MSTTIAEPAPAAQLARSRPRVRPVVLLILDGFGSREPAPDNAISNADMPHWTALLATSPHTTIDASELHVGLPGGQMGNSEVGHLNIGAGRVVYQDFTRIDHAIATGEFARNPVLGDALALAARGGGALHVLGLLSPGGVHSHERQIAALVALAAHGRRPANPRPCVPGWPRHAAAQRGRVARLHGRRVRAGEGRAHRVDRRPLLRDGPRPALGPHPRGLRSSGRRPRALHGSDGAGRPRRGLRARRKRRIRQGHGHRRRRRPRRQR